MAARACPPHQTRRADQGHAAQARIALRFTTEASWGRGRAARLWGSRRHTLAWARLPRLGAARRAHACRGVRGVEWTSNWLFPLVAAHRCLRLAVDERGLATGFSWTSGNVPRPTLPPRGESSLATCRVCWPAAPFCRTPKPVLRWERRGRRLVSAARVPRTPPLRRAHADSQANAMCTCVERPRAINLAVTPPNTVIAVGCLGRRVENRGQ